MKQPVVFVFLLFLLIFNSCSESENTKEAISISKKKPVLLSLQKVKIDEVKKESFPLQIISTGILRAAKKATLRFQTSGIISRLNVQNGDKVKAGQLLASLENKSREIALENAENSIEAAKIEFNSLLLGFGSGKTDSSKLNRELLQSLKIQSGLQSALLDKKQAQLALDRTSLFAPFTGIIAGLKNQQYDLISANEVFCTLLDNNRFDVYFSVTEDEIASVYKGEKVLIEPFADENKQYTGHISRINPVVDKNGLIKITAVISPDQNKTHSQTHAFTLMDGMNVKVIIENNIPGQLVIPKQAVVLRSNKKVAFTYVKGLAKWHYIKTKYENSHSYSVSGGLKAGDTIIVQGNLNLANNAEVKIVK